MLAAALLLASSAWGSAPAKPCAETPLSEIAARAAKGDPPSLAGDARLRWDLLRHHQFLAFARRDPAVCEGVKGLAIPGYGGYNDDDASWACRDTYYELRHGMTLIIGSGFDEACRESMIHTNVTFPAEFMDRACGIVKRRFPDARTLCAELNPVYPEQASTCLALYGEMAGDASNCKDGERERHCYAPFARAWKAGDPALCGQSDVCLALMGRGRDVAAGYAKRARQSYCAAIEAAKAPARAGPSPASAREATPPPKP